MTRNSVPPIQRDWLSKSLAGTVLGLVLAMACSGLFTLATRTIEPGIRAQLAMWLVSPVWMGVLASVFLFSSGRLAWQCLLVASVVAWSAYAVAYLIVRGNL